jgi:hypothetical protein
MVSAQEETTAQTPPPSPQPDMAAGLGAKEDQPVETPAKSDDDLVENISTGEHLPVSGDWSEGQTHADYKSESGEDETRQST